MGNKYKSAASSTANKRGSFALVRCSVGGRSVFRCCQIQFFFRHEVDVYEDFDDKFINMHTFAYVKWFKACSIAFDKFQEHNFMQVVQNTFEPESVESILPVTSLFAPAAVVTNHLQNINVVVHLPQRLIP
ncbi:hypothetical protein EDC96DRAFT_531953 [Choanephora cucurbitarum]|nr:hypothetical protein EDC96DRAFT_531953 [Choanephora cucurbitarum]